MKRNTEISEYCVSPCVSLNIQLSNKYVLTILICTLFIYETFNMKSFLQNE